MVEARLSYVSQWPNRKAMLMSNSANRYDAFDALLTALKASVADFKKAAIEVALCAFDHFESDDRDLRPQTLEGL